MKKTVTRKTKETEIRIEIARGSGVAKVRTGKPFFDHMLATFAKYAGFDLTIEAQGDLTHHLMEDVAITLGAAVRELVPETAARYGDQVLAMDDALVQAAVDLGGRFYYRGKLPSRLYTHVLRSFAEHARFTVHIRKLRGRGPAPPDRGVVQGARPRDPQGDGRGRHGVQHQGLRRPRGEVMLSRRLIVCLDVKGGRVVKGVRFEGLRDVGDPVSLAQRYEQEGADEVVFLDISASEEERRTLLDVAERTAERLFIPLTARRRHPERGRRRAGAPGGRGQGEPELRGGEAARGAHRVRRALRRAVRGREHRREGDLARALRRLHPRRQARDRARGGLLGRRSARGAERARSCSRASTATARAPATRSSSPGRSRRRSRCR